MKKVIELIRVSTEGQAASDRASIPAQNAVNRRTCAQYELEIVKSIQMSDVSGASVLLTPEIAELVELMKAPEIHGVVAREFSRLMRPENFEDFALLQAFVDSRTVLYLPEGPIDLTNKTGRLMGTIRAAIAGLERTEILERVWSAKEEKRRRGELAQSPIVLPFGVGYAPDKGFYYKPEAERVREAFRQFLAGNHSYHQLARIVGVTPRGMHIILRNPIWTGWRVIDKKRDSSAAGRYAGKNGRQADRRKVARAPEEIIRVKVIAEPLISDTDFAAVQRVMDIKQTRHWRSQPDLEHRFTYNGFLTCSECGEVIHTALARRDYYACSGRRVRHRCIAGYMGRERLESVLDELFGRQLTSAAFIEQCLDTWNRKNTSSSSLSRRQQLTDHIAGLRERRTRVLDSYVDGHLSRGERDARFATIDNDLRLAQDALLRENPAAGIRVESAVEIFSALAEWEFWTRDQKRAVLANLVPDIRVADYVIESLGLNAQIFSGSNESSRMAVGFLVAEPTTLYLPITYRGGL